MAFLRRSRGDDEPVIEPEPRPTVPEGTAQERRAMVVEAGWGRISIGSALAGLFVAIGMVALLVGAALIAWADVGRHILTRDLHTLGVPTAGGRWETVATVSGIEALATMCLGSLLGGIAGERWHASLVRRAAAPGYGPTAVGPGYGRVSRGADERSPDEDWEGAVRR